MTMAVEMWHSGKSAREIAATLNRPLASTKNKLARMRAKKGKPAAKPKTQTAQDAKRFLETVAPVAPPDPVAAPKPPCLSPVLTGAQRELMMRIIQLPDDFTPADDLYLAEQIIARTGLELIADQLGCDRQAVLARWAALLGMDPADLRRGVPLQMQTDLMLVLRQLAGEAAA